MKTKNKNQYRLTWIVCILVSMNATFRIFFTHSAGMFLPINVCIVLAAVIIAVIFLIKDINQVNANKNNKELTGKSFRVSNVSNQHRKQLKSKKQSTQGNTTECKNCRAKISQLATICLNCGESQV